MMHTLTSITIFKKRMQVLSKFALIKLSIFKQILLKTSCNYVILGITKQNPSYVENQRSFKDPRGIISPTLKRKSNPTEQKKEMKYTLNIILTSVLTKIQGTPSQKTKKHQTSKTFKI